MLSDGDSRILAPLRTALLRDLLLAPAGPLARLEVLDQVDSTSSELARQVAAEPEGWPAPALVLADHQEAGRGRLDRAWQTPPRTALTGSLLLRPEVPRERWTWVPLLSGLAVVTALRATGGVAAALKWPNDVLLPAPEGAELLGWGAQRKVGGILTEVLPDGAVVVGVGVNVTQRAQELPVPSATSLLLARAATTDREVLVTAMAESFADVLARWQDADGDAVAAGLHAEVTGVLATRGQQVRAIVAGGREVHGTATGLAPDGGLLVQTTSGMQTVRSGDVRHVRAAGSD